MELKLEPQGKAGIQDPIGEEGWGKNAMRRGHQHGASGKEVVAPNHMKGEVEVGPVRYHELHLVMGQENIQVLPAVVAGLPGARAFHVHDAAYSGIHPLDVEGSVGLKEHCAAQVAEGNEEPRNGGHKEGLSSRDHHEIGGASGLHGLQDLLEGHGGAGPMGILCVAVSASQVAPGEPEEGGWLSRPSGLPRKGAEDLANREDGL